MDPLWTHSYKCTHIGTHYGPIHIRLFIYGPIMDPFIYVYSYMDPLWTHSYKCIHIWTHQGPIHIRLSLDHGQALKQPVTSDGSPTPSDATEHRSPPPSTPWRRPAAHGGGTSTEAALKWVNRKLPTVSREILRNPAPYLEHRDYDLVSSTIVTMLHKNPTYIFLCPGIYCSARATNFNHLF